MRGSGGLGGTRGGTAKGELLGQKEKGRGKEQMGA